ncbi:MAG TPA: thiamine diphosphokinase, partial [Anaerolineales bacterium]
DGGARHAIALGKVPSVVIGDLDSLADGDRRLLESLEVRFLQHPRDKNETDLELALQHAQGLGISNILLIGALGGRLDHALGNLSVLSDPALAGFDVRADDGQEEVFFCRESVGIRGQKGDTVSLLPWGQMVRGVRTSGLRWQLSGETLYPHKTRGISNELMGEFAEVQIAFGLLLIVHRRKS